MFRIFRLKNSKLWIGLAIAYLFSKSIVESFVPISLGNIKANSFWKNINTKIKAFVGKK